MAAAPLDIELLSAPISSVSPAGEDIRMGSKVELYYRLKDARSLARNEERSQAPGEPFRLSPAWGDVRSLAIELLEGTTSDIEILAWLAEAELRLNGFAGLAQVFDLGTALVEDRFDALHSIDGDTLADKVAPLSGLNGVGGEGTLIQPIRLSPVIPERGFFQSSLWDFQLAQRSGEEARRKELKDAAIEAGPAAMRRHLEAITRALQSFNALTAALDTRCGPEAPASSAIRSVLDEARLAVINLGGLEREVATESGVADKVPEAAEAAGTPAQAQGAGPIRSREDAFDRLLDVADYFRRTEPQSPVAGALDTIVARGRMDFTALLAELVQDEQTRRNILISAGIRPNPDRSS
jgi:type VI secretion system protein ImpA